MKQEKLKDTKKFQKIMTYFKTLHFTILKKFKRNGRRSMKTKPG